MEVISTTTFDHSTLLSIDDGKVNALSPQLINQLRDALSQSITMKKPIVIAGRPTVFCAGYDLAIMNEGTGPRKALMHQGVELFLDILRAPVPVIAACTGHAFAAGALLLLSADLRIGENGPYRIGLNEVSVGFPLSKIGMEMARARLDPRNLTERVVFGRVEGVDAAVRDGFLDRSVDDKVVQAALAEAEHIASLSAHAVCTTKQELRAPLVSVIEGLLDTAGADWAN